MRSPPSLSSDGFYSRSLDYMEIVNSNRRGLWNVPYTSSCYLIQVASSLLVYCKCPVGT